MLLNDNFDKMDSSISLHVLDYVIFFGVLLGSLTIGIYYSFSQKSSSEYLQGKRRMRLVPVSIAMIVSFVSAVTMQVIGHVLVRQQITTLYPYLSVYKLLFRRLCRSR